MIILQCSDDEKAERDDDNVIDMKAMEILEESIFYSNLPRSSISVQALPIWENI